MTKRVILGLTGSIGMGKTTTAQMFRDHDVPVWDADAVVAKLYGRGGLAVAPVGDVFAGVTDENGVNRTALRRLIADDPTVLAEIEAIVHPLVRADRAQFLQDHAAAPLVVLDIPLLFETQHDTNIDYILVVSAPPDVQRDRVLSRGTMDEAALQMLLRRQMPDAEKRKKADFVIETVSIEQVKAKVETLITELAGA